MEGGWEGEGVSEAGAEGVSDTAEKGIGVRSALVVPMCHAMSW